MTTGAPLPASRRQPGTQEMRRKLSAVCEIQSSFLTSFREMVPENVIKMYRWYSCADALPAEINAGKGHGSGAQARRRKDSPQNSRLASSPASRSHTAACSISSITPVRSRNGFTC